MKRCPNKTRRNKITHECEPINKTRERTPINTFILLCKKHIMVPTLDNIIQTTWLYNDKTNVFLIGERHACPNICTGVQTMFKSLIKDISNQPDRDIDIFLEMTQEEAAKPFMCRDNQLSKTRTFFKHCIVSKECIVRVHWNDARTQPWLQRLANYPFDASWTADPEIRKQLQSEKDIIKLLTENPVVVKEIQKSKMTMKFAKQQFMDIFEQYKQSGIEWEMLVKYQLRCVIDIYMVARMLKSNMKNVIYYSGNAHSQNVIRILTALRFRIKQQVNGECV